MNDLKVIAFDADDTLWVNEPNFQKAEHNFCNVLKNYENTESISSELLKTEIQNIELYGYGVKGFILSMIETANRISNNRVKIEEINQIIEIGKNILNLPIELLPGVPEVLTTLKNQNRYQLILATKGDLLDQERKLRKSQLASYFHHIEIMSEKHEENYQKLLKQLEIQPNQFLMIGNSLKSDIIPVVEIGAKAIYIPFHTTWAMENMHNDIHHSNYHTVSQLTDILDLL